MIRIACLAKRLEILFLEDFKSSNFGFPFVYTNDSQKGSNWPSDKFKQFEKKQTIKSCLQLVVILELFIVVFTIIESISKRILALAVINRLIFSFLLFFISFTENSSRTRLKRIKFLWKECELVDSITQLKV